MIPDSKGAIQLLLLACICSAGVAAESPSHSGFGLIPGSKFGTVGADIHRSFGSYYTEDRQGPWIPVDLVFRAGTVFSPCWAVGVELGFSRLFLQRMTDSRGRFYIWRVFETTPVVHVAPAVTYFCPFGLPYAQPYGSLGSGVTYGRFDNTPGLVGWRTKVAVGMIDRFSARAGLGLELGWYHDYLPAGEYRPVEAVTGSSIYLNLHFAGLLEP